MAGRQRRDHGGILGLQQQLVKPDVRAALQYDLLTRGLTLDLLGSEAFSWYDLAAVFKHLQNDPSTALSTELHGVRWSIEAQLTAVVADHLAFANWQRAGRRSAQKPKRIPRPWEKPKATSLGEGAIPIANFNDWWDSQSTKKPPTA